MTCDQCERDVTVLFECYDCGDQCCDKCIAGAGTRCFQCEEAEDESEGDDED